jgi:hypothetical protein
VAHALRDTVNERAGELSARVYAEAAPRVERVADVVTDLVSDTAAPAVAAGVETLHDALDAAALRGGAAWVALRGGTVGPPVAARRWPWAVGAAVLGAAAGAGVALLVGRLLLGRDAPDAQDPADLEAVVDRDVDRPADPPVAERPGAS